jgi:hypothetical protein
VARRRWTMIAALAVAPIALFTGIPWAIAAQGEVEGSSDSSSAPIRSDLQREVLAPGHSSNEERDLRLGPRPRFIAPAATTTEHTRLGLSAWIVEGAPFERRENPGGVAMGITIAWPPPRAERPPAPHP